MRDPKRIEEVLSVIKNIWYANPDLRLMQLLGNVVPGERDNYYLEDDKLLEMLKNYGKQQKPAREIWQHP